MVKGIHLTLMVGPAVPVPVSKEVIDALISIEVTTSSGTSQSGFQMSFRLDKDSPLHTLFLLSGGNMLPILRTVIVVTLNGTSEVLMDGVVLHTQVSSGGEAGKQVLTVSGKDLSAVMDIVELDGIPYPAMPPVARVGLILAKYASLGIIPKIIPSVIQDITIPTEQIRRHKGTDLAYLKLLAQQSGYVFYIEPGPVPATSTAYWGPYIKVGAPQPALNTDMDAQTNVESIDFTFDKEKKEMPVVFIQNEESKAVIPIPIPDITPLNPPLGAVPPIPPKIKFMYETANKTPFNALMHGLAYASQNSDCLFADGSLDVLRYGRILKARKLVGVRGAGVAYNGLYYVSSVTHRIRRGEYKQNFKLSRNGLISTIPKVPV